GLAVGTPYWYAVYADYNGSNSPVAYAASQPTTTQPPTPTNLVAIGETSTTVYLSWNGSSGATSYILLRKGPNDPSYISLSLANYPTSFTDSGLVPSTAYSYVLEASN